MHIFHKHLFNILATQGEATWCYKHIEQGEYMSHATHVFVPQPMQKRHRNKRLHHPFCVGLRQSTYRQHIWFYLKHSDMHVP